MDPVDPDPDSEHWLVGNLPSLMDGVLHSTFFSMLDSSTGTGIYFIHVQILQRQRIYLSIVLCRATTPVRGFFLFAIISYS